MKQFDYLKKYCEECHIPYTEEVSERFSTYCEMLVETNKVMNLTAVTDPGEIELKHFVDSLAAVSMIRDISNEKAACEDHQAENLDNSSYTQSGNNKKENNITRVVDIGTGAGFPGLPLAIVLPDMQFVLADSLNKRIGFLQNVISSLNISNADAIQGRAEDLGQGELREKFDVCVSRAVADMAVLLEYCLPLVKVGGRVILYKSGNYQEELARAEYAMEILGGKLAEVREFQLPGSDIGRSLIVIHKITNTPGKYPRRAGKPTKSPLGSKEGVCG